MAVLSRPGSTALGLSTLTTLAGGVVSVHLWLRAFTGGVEAAVPAPSVVAIDREVVPALLDLGAPRRAASGRSVDGLPSGPGRAQAPGQTPAASDGAASERTTPTGSDAVRPPSAPGAPAPPAPPPPAPPQPAPPGGGGGSGPAAIPPSPPAVQPAPPTPAAAPQPKPADPSPSVAGKKPKHERRPHVTATQARPAVPAHRQDPPPVPPAATPAVPAVPPTHAATASGPPPSASANGHGKPDDPGGHEANPGKKP
jgi:hypothetical protein